MDVKWAVQKLERYVKELIRESTSRSAPQCATGRGLPPVGTLVVIPPTESWGEEIWIVMSSGVGAPTQTVVVDIEKEGTNPVRISALGEEYFEWIADDFSLWIL